MIEEEEKQVQGGSGWPAVAVVAVAVVAVIAYVVLQKQKFEPVVAGARALDFTLPLVGKPGEASLSDYRGKVVFLNFWATWCKPCEDEMPSMQRLYEKYRDRGLEMLAVSVDSGSPDVVEAFVRKYGLTFPVLHDRKSRVKEIYKTTGVPETFIIDQNGVIAEKVWGPRDWTSPLSTAVIERLINEGPGTPESYRARGGGH
ncbi:MAG TPA: TlpA family protein disulfide reductase [Deltaproteobacteria bacterium]|nr:TlpA family protein disulfide reductase [Deltaproteobacteria bacterium]